MGLQTVYCSRENFELITLFPEDSEEYKILFNVLKNYSDIVIDITQEDFENEITNNPNYLAFLKREAFDLIPYPDYISNTDNIDMEIHSKDILLVDNSIKNTSEIRKATGALVLNTDELHLIKDYYKPLEFLFSRDNQNFFKNWDDLFKAKQIQPSNSAIVVDGYLLKKFEKRKQNLYSILEAIIPKELEIPFHLTLVVDNSQEEINQVKAQELIQVLDSQILNSTGIKSNIGLATYIKRSDDRFHERVIMTNNFYIHSGKGFAVFEEDKGEQKLSEQTDGSIRWVYDSVCGIIGEIKKRRHDQYLKDVRDLIKKNETSGNRLSFNAGDMRNRLLVLLDSE